MKSLVKKMMVPLLIGFVLTIVIHISLANEVRGYSLWGFAGAYWLVLPLFLGIVLVRRANQLHQSSPDSWFGFVVDSLSISLVSQIGLWLYALLVSPLKLPGIFLGSLISLMGLLMLANIAYFFRNSRFKWMSYPLVVFWSLIGMTRGLIYIISGNMGGSIRTLGEWLVLLAPPLNQVAYLAKDLASFSSVSWTHLQAPVLYLLFTLILVVVSRLEVKRIIQWLAVVVLITGLWFGSGWSNQRVDQITYQAFEQAAAWSEGDLWPGYRFGDVQYAVKEGRNEIVFRLGTDQVYQEETIDVIAYTATIDEGLPTLYVLNYQDSRGLIDPFNTLSPEESLERYVSVLCHEGFHAYQFAQLEEEQDDGLGDMGAVVEFGPILESESYKALWNRELKAIYDYLEGEIDFFEYQLARRERQAYEKEQLGADEYIKYQRGQEVLETIEGTAHYIEMMSLNRERSQNQLYLNLSEGASQSFRYYLSGMGRSLMMDEREPGWKDQMVFNRAIQVE